ncbi:MAG: hypothetical protein RMY34_26040 [Aulosira sp. DedQUE10]|nr:hypothetical protein [Aulosira sp. DedQUE10]
MYPSHLHNFAQDTLSKYLVVIDDHKSQNTSEHYYTANREAIAQNHA